jgi:prepilin-type N-terminal cleavage/methylation domain-containing protein
MGRLNKKGFTLAEIMIVVLVIGLLAAIAIPNFVKARETAQKNTCINNLRLIDASKGQYALENDVSTGSTTPSSTNLAEYFKDSVFPTCPTDNSAYTVNPIGTDPACTSGETGHNL